MAIGGSVPTEHVWSEREVTLLDRQYRVRHCQRCHRDMAKLLGDVWVPVHVSAFSIEPLDAGTTPHASLEDCPLPA
jgi:hypothetical protein